jgi:transposase
LGLRTRVVEAVEAGATRQAAGDRFGVSDSSAIRWVQRWRATGEFAAKRRGGSNSPLEKHAAVLLALVAEQPDLTLDEWCAMLREREIVTSRVSVWRFFDRHKVSYKKNPARQRARTGQTWRRHANAGGGTSSPLIPRIWCSSTRPVPAPI